MKRYVFNLWDALRGRNPYRQELDELNRQVESAQENVQSWKAMYYKVWDNIAATEAEMKEKDKQIVSLQSLVENLRERIREKDARLEEQGRAFRELLEQTRREHDKRIATYAEEIERSQNNK